MKDRKRRLELFSFYDYTGMERHLEKMAERGWLLETVGFLWKYRRIVPQKLHFSVCFYPNASELDPTTPEGQLAYQELCGHTGWVLAAQSGQMQIFYNEQENPTPIETDPGMEIDTVHRAVKKTYLVSYFVLLGIAVIQLAFLTIQAVQDPIHQLSSNTWLFSVLCWVLIFVMMSVDLIGYYHWRYRAREAAENGEFRATRGHSRIQKSCIALILVSFVWLVLELSDPMSRAV